MARFTALLPAATEMLHTRLPRQAGAAAGSLSAGGQDYSYRPSRRDTGMTHTSIIGHSLLADRLIVMPPMPSIEQEFMPAEPAICLTRIDTRNIFD